MRLVAAFSLAMMTLASAQSLPLPPMGGDRPITIPLTNNSNGEKIGICQWQPFLSARS